MTEEKAKKLADSITAVVKAEPAKFDEFLNLSAFSFLLVLLVDFIPVAPPWVYPLPDFTLIMLAYWLLHRPQLIGIGAAFCLGLLVDIGTNSLLGQHGLAYSVAAFLIERNRRQIVLNSFGWQAIAVTDAILVSDIRTMLNFS